MNKHERHIRAVQEAFKGFPVRVEQVKTLPTPGPNVVGGLTFERDLTPDELADAVARVKAVKDILSGKQPHRTPMRPDLARAHGPRDGMAYDLGDDEPRRKAVPPAGARVRLVRYIEDPVITVAAAMGLTPPPVGAEGVVVGHEDVGPGPEDEMVHVRFNDEVSFLCQADELELLKEEPR